jgi:hypothetical protein
VSQHDALLLCGPAQNCWVVGLRETYALSAKDVQLGTPALGAPDDVVVEVLVGE